jgi:rhodanese-related sulfurtransferase
MRDMNNLKLSSIALLCLLLAGCNFPWWGSSKQTTQDSQASTAPAVSKLLVINVLEPRYHEDAHIKGSVNVPFDKLESKARDWDKSTHIVVYCANYQCTASSEAVRRLKALGFGNVRAYEGGTAEWHTKGYPITGPAKEKYLEMVGTPMATHDVETVKAEQLLSEMQEAEKAGKLIKN